MNPTASAHQPPLDPAFVPAALWTARFSTLVSADPGARRVVIALSRSDGTVFHHETRLLGPGHAETALNLRHTERLLKFLLWQKGGSRVTIAGAPEIARALAEIYGPAGARAFDAEFMGRRVYGETFSVKAAGFDELPGVHSHTQPVGRQLAGCRIGFDLGGSDRKAAALIDGRVVYSEEIRWDPYFQANPEYHLAGVQDSLERAARHLPRVDAIGGSAAGIYVNNEVRVASLFRAVPEEAFRTRIRPMFRDLQRRWGGVPFEVCNDGEVTALAGSLALGENRVLGVSLGTSMAGGFVQADGTLTPWLNELAFVPVDYRDAAPVDEWSGDAGCGVQYFSQQAVNRLALAAGFVFPEGMPLPERLAEVQRANEQGDPRAEAVFHSIGVYLGHAVAQLAEYYDLRHVLLLGRVTSGRAGAQLLARAGEVLREVYPAVAGQVRLHLPDETERRHGQAIAAASLPTLPQSVVP